MTFAPVATNTNPRRLGRSFLSVALGFVAVVFLSLATDEILHVLKVYPPWNEPMYDTGLCLLALSYRIVYTVLGGYITARYAPYSPVRHALILAIMGTAIGIAGALATIPLHIGPTWYAIAVAATGVFAWIGGVLYTRRAGMRPA